MAYEAAAAALGINQPVEAWMQALERSDPGPYSIWASSLARNVPYNVDVDARVLSRASRGELVSRWLDLLPEITEIRVTGRLPLDSLSTWIQDAAGPGRRVTPTRWGLNSAGQGWNISRSAVLAAFTDAGVQKGLRSWQVRAASIRWEVPDSTMMAGEANSVTLVQAPRTFRRTIEIVLDIEDMDSPRFRAAIAALEPHVPADLRADAAWKVWGDPASTERGCREIRQWTMVRQAANDSLWRHSGAILSPLVNLFGGGRPEGPKGSTEIKKTLLASMEAELPDFPFEATYSRIGTGVSDDFVFVRTRPSGTRNFLFFRRDRDPYATRAFDVEAAINALAGHPYASVSAQTTPEGLTSAFWGMYNLCAFSKVGGFYWYFNNQESFNRSLRRAIERIRKVVLPMFEDVEPLLVEWRALARR